MSADKPRDPLDDPRSYSTGIGADQHVVGWWVEPVEQPPTQEKPDLCPYCGLPQQQCQGTCGGAP